MKPTNSMYDRVSVPIVTGNPGQSKDDDEQRKTEKNSYPGQNENDRWVVMEEQCDETKEIMGKVQNLYKER